MFAGSLAIGVLAITAAVLGGIDPILGAFATGLLTPRSTYVQAAASYLRRLSTAALPLFFALSGMSVEIPALTGALPAVAFWTLLCTVTKVGASFLAATATRLGPRESLTAGALMNCRGVVGIIFLTLAERNGLIEASAYSVLLLVFLICTVICTPIVEWLGVAASLRAPRTPLANTALADS
jgi:Kef-type K+ transport system membrane component KefB